MQFALYLNTNSQTKKLYPYLLDIQHEILSDLATHIVAPLILKSSLHNQMLSKLTPCVDIDGKSYIIMIPELAGIAKKNLGKVYMDLRPYREEIITAIDFLVSGI